MTSLLYGKLTVWRQSRSRRTGKRLLWFSRGNAVLFDSRLSWWRWWDRITSWGSGSISKVEMKGLASTWAARRESWWTPCYQDLFSLFPWMLPSIFHPCLFHLSLWFILILHVAFENMVSKSPKFIPSHLATMEAYFIFIHQTSARSCLGHGPKPWTNHRCQENGI